MIGYLAFPIQMAYRYPDLARFMAAHWATGAVHKVPIFGEKGAWLEHFAFDAFYNYPLTIRRRIRKRAEARADRLARSWHAPLISLASTGLLAFMNFSYFRIAAQPPSFGSLWWLTIWIPIATGAFTSRWAGGMRLGKRIFRGTLASAAAGLLYGIFMALGPRLFPLAGPAVASQGTSAALSYVKFPVEYALLFGLLATAGAIITETRKIK